MQAEQQKKDIKGRCLMAMMVAELCRLGANGFAQWLAEFSPEERTELATAWDNWQHTPVGVMFNRPNF